MFLVPYGSCCKGMFAKLVFCFGLLSVLWECLSVCFSATLPANVPVISRRLFADLAMQN